MAASPFWETPPASLQLGDGEVHVWRADLDIPPATIDRLQKTLSPAEQQKASRFHFAKDRLRYMIARGVLRCLAGRYCGQEPESFQFACNPWGKPALQNLSMPLQFNLSHSGEIVLHAFTVSREIGIDHETIRPDFATQEIAERFFSPMEASRLRSLRSEVQARAFFTCWTRKEAYLKGRGKGLSIGLNRFEVSFASNEPPALLLDQNEPAAIHRWTLHEVPLGSDYVGAVAVEGKDLQLSFWQWQG